MSRSRGTTRRSIEDRLAAILVLTMVGQIAAGCGNVDWGGGGSDDATVSVAGNVDAVSPVTVRDIVVFAYSVDDDSQRCPCPADPSNSTSGKAVVLSSGESEFSLSGVPSGPVGIVFLLDNAGDNADGEINPGDPIAILDDPDCDLSDVSGNLTVTLEDIDLNFSSSPATECEDGVEDPPASGRARAGKISLATTATTE